MPSKIVNDLIAKIQDLHDSLDTHLIESTGIKTDIVWLKRIMWIIVAGILSLWLKG